MVIWILFFLVIGGGRLIAIYRLSLHRNVPDRNSGKSVSVSAKTIGSTSIPKERVVSARFNSVVLTSGDTDSGTCQLLERSYTEILAEHKTPDRHKRLGGAKSAPKSVSRVRVQVVFRIKTSISPV